MPHDVSDAAVRARAFWSGTLTFGLVSIPVALFPANRSQGVSLRMLDANGTPLSRRYFNPETGREVPRERITRGYELEDGSFVRVTDEELESLAPEKTRDIDLRRFVQRDELDPMYFDRAYYLTPAGNSTKPYRLLVDAMERTGRAGIATFVMRGKEYLVAILAEEGILRAETMRFADELRTPEVVGLPEPAKPPAKAVKAMEKELKKAIAKSLDERELEDDYAGRLRKLVEKKRKAGKDLVTSGAPEEEDEEGDVIDLMEVLKRSMQGVGGGRRPPRKAGTAGADRTAEDLASLTKEQLYERARTLDVPGRSSMTKDQLIAALQRVA